MNEGSRRGVRAGEKIFGTQRGDPEIFVVLSTKESGVTSGRRSFLLSVTGEGLSDVDLDTTKVSGPLVQNGSLSSNYGHPVHVDLGEPKPLDSVSTDVGGKRYRVPHL